MNSLKFSHFIRLTFLTIWTLSMSAFFLIALATPTEAHRSGFPFRFVAQDGVDQDDCDDPTAPCRTILYAINRAMLGDQVRVAAGTYFVDNADINLLRSPVIPVKGGYQSNDQFAVQNTEENKTYLVGPDASYKEDLEANGFVLLTDAKQVDLEITDQTINLQSKIAEVTSFTPCQNNSADGYPCQGIDLLARMPLSSFSSTPSAANDIWGYVDLDDNREYAIIGLWNGTAVVDVTDPFNPVEIGTISGLGTTWRDIKVYQFFNGAENRWDAYAYVVADNVNQGLQIIDLSDLPNSISLANTYTGFQRAHNIYLSDVDYTTGVTQSDKTAYAYILGSNLDGGRAHILDLTNPTSPVQTAGSFSASGYVHDASTLIITDTRTADCAGHNPCEIYVDFNENTVDLWDVTDKSAPVQISVTPYDGARYTHSGWWSEDRMFIFIQDELDELFVGHNTRLRVLDISDLTTPFISRVWEGPSSAIDHNGYTRKNHYYMSNYRRGLTLLDVADPNQPQHIAYFDTYPADDNGSFSGAWGVYPYLPSGTLLISDISNGLYLLREQGLAIKANGPTNVPTTELITYTLTVTNNGIFAAQNIVITNALPSSSIYLDGGMLVGGNVVSWTIDSLAPGAAQQVTLTISHTDSPITNDFYAVSGQGSITTSHPIYTAGEERITTVITSDALYLPTIIKSN